MQVLCHPVWLGLNTCGVRWRLLQLWLIEFFQESCTYAAITPEVFPYPRGPIGLNQIELQLEWKIYVPTVFYH